MAKRRGWRSSFLSRLASSKAVVVPTNEAPKKRRPTSENTETLKGESRTIRGAESHMRQDLDPGPEGNPLMEVFGMDLVPVQASGKKTISVSLF